MLNQASKARNWKKWGTWPRLWLCRATCRWCRALCGLWSGKNVQSKTCDIIYDESETIWTFVPPHPKNMIPFNPQLAKAPAATLRSFSQAAGADLGQVTAKPTKQNASRDAHRFVCNWGLSWKVPLSEFKYVDSNNQEHVISYISPISYMTFLVEKAPELLMGGVQNLKQGCRQLGSFWQNYKKLHPTHRLFQDAHPSRTTSNTFAMCFHGDEGRGKKKGNTAVLMMETCLGVNTAENIKLKKDMMIAKNASLGIDVPRGSKPTLGPVRSLRFKGTLNHAPSKATIPSLIHFWPSSFWLFYRTSCTRTATCWSSSSNIFAKTSRPFLILDLSLATNSGTWQWLA